AGRARQRCPSRGTVIVHEQVHDAFLARYAEAVETAAIGDPFEDVLYGPMISSRFRDRFLGWLDWVQPHHTLSGSSATGRITRDAPRAGFVGDPAGGAFVRPTIVDGVTMDDDLYKQETFGPIVGVASFGDFEEAITLANGHGYGLSASIYTTDPLNVFRFRERISAGMGGGDNSTTGAAHHLPLGGHR